MNRGVLYAATAYLLWGFFPAFWKQLSVVPPVEILGHRIAWSLIFLALILLYRGEWQQLKTALKRPRTTLLSVGAATLLALNWFTYVWAVNNGFIVETSLGYFINPLINVLLGVLFLRERVRVWQWLALLIATTGVVWLTVSYGTLPWIALTLACSFGLYGLVRKTGALNSLHGLSAEMAILFLPALGLLFYLELEGAARFGHGGIATSLLLATGGVITAVPLLLFAAGARRIRLVTLGVLQYSAPTLQFILGVFVYDEPFNQDRMVGFILIWLALLIYTVEGLMDARNHAGLGYAR